MAIWRNRKEKGAAGFGTSKYCLRPQKEKSCGDTGLTRWSCDRQNGSYPASQCSLGGNRYLCQWITECATLRRAGAKLASLSPLKRIKITNSRQTLRHLQKEATTLEGPLQVHRCQIHWHNDCSIQKENRGNFVKGIKTPPRQSGLGGASHRMEPISLGPAAHSIYPLPQKCSPLCIPAR